MALFVLLSTYVVCVQDDDGQRVDKMDFKLELPSVTFLTPISITK